MKLFVCVDHYLPGFRAGGPPRTLSNMVQRLKNVDFWIFTRNHDYADVTPYPNVAHDAWNQVDRAHVFYCSPGNLTFSNIRRRINEVAPDAIYLNSFFSTITVKCLFLRRFRFLPPVAVIIAPRGEFSSNVLRLKALKKQLYLKLALALGLYRNLIWQASSSVERQDILRVMGESSDVHVALNLPGQTPLARPREEQETKLHVHVASDLALHGARANEPKDQARKVPGRVQLVFLSRICINKNLSRAIELLETIKGEAEFDIYGPIDDERYWRSCEQRIALLPPNCRVTYRGSLPPAEVIETLSRYHFFLLPTFCENFGHAIFEALMAGTPVIVSDQTPWRNLRETGAGWDLDLREPNQWEKVLQECVDMGESTYRHHSAAACTLAERVSSSDEVEEQNVALFALAHGCARSNGKSKCAE
jgi:glycosyltransferase involved in cell wall biosynthesis